jgi:hypothetical protein
MAHNEKQTWHAIEEQAYHAFREWPVWLVLRQKELDVHIGKSPENLESSKDHRDQKNNE